MFSSWENFQGGQFRKSEYVRKVDKDKWGIFFFRKETAMPERRQFHMAKLVPPSQLG